jgi:hypothetical protein
VVVGRAPVVGGVGGACHPLTRAARMWQQHRSVGGMGAAVEPAGVRPQLQRGMYTLLVR